MRAPWPWLALSLSGCLLMHERARVDDDDPPIAEEPPIDAGVMPPDLPSPVFDPNEVYLVGQHLGDRCSGFVISDWRTPTEPIADFLPCDIERATIRPGDGRLLFQVGGTGRGFLAVGQGGMPYDEPVDTSRCNENGVLSILLNPEGAYLYGCRAGGWYDTLGRPLWDPGDMIFTDTAVAAYGADDMLLTSNGLWHLTRREESRITFRETDVGYFAFRALSDGFWMVIGDGYEGEITLRHVGFDGRLTIVGSFGFPSKGTLDSALNARGDLFQLVSRISDGQVSVERRTLDGTIETLHVNGASAGELSFSMLVTGP